VAVCGSGESRRELSTASVLPALRASTVEDLARAGLDRDRVAASAVRLIDLGLFGVGGENMPSWTIITAPRRWRSGRSH
jgi:hypothetical protein